MTKSNGVWVAVADAGKARLLHCTVAPPGRRHVEEAARLASPETGHEHGRPSPRQNRMGGTSQTHEDEEQLRRFAKQTASWLAKQAQQRRLEEVALFAAPRLLGALRTVFNAHPPVHLHQHEADLTNLDTRALSEHPLICRLLPIPSTPRQM